MKFSFNTHIIYFVLLFTILLGTSDLGLFRTLCQRCDGSGLIDCSTCYGTGHFLTSEVCKDCDGFGDKIPEVEKISEEVEVERIEVSKILLRVNLYITAEFYNHDEATYGDVLVEVKDEGKIILSKVGTLWFPGNSKYELEIEYTVYQDVKAPVCEINIVALARAICRSCWGDGKIFFVGSCYECEGSGEVLCPYCGGQGTVINIDEIIGISFVVVYSVIGVMIVLVMYRDRKRAHSAEYIYEWRERS